ncbi:MAG: CehA/McbA family metallohydrolase [Chloroflexi bacterium]|nr:CehA/McbA family metallohydrolase [Chloroflexota bacterium]
MHTTYSDGRGSHADIARAGLKSGLDAVIVTDHNVLVNGMEGFTEANGRRLLMLVGEEIHDQARQPQKNHLLAIGAGRELAPFARDPQQLINLVRQAGGLAFIAHPVDPELPAFGEDDISWVDWSVQGFTGIELWNGFSELKTVIKHRYEALFYAFFPQYIARGPLRETLQRWDQLNIGSGRIVAVGGSDAHALRKTLGPLRATLFPYEFHFRAINTHLYTPSRLTGNLMEDRSMILSALRLGHAFIGYDLPASTRGFRYTGQGRDQTVLPGDEISASGGVTLQIHLPRPAECILIKDGKPLKTWENRVNFTHITSSPGVYRVEAYLHAFGQRRGWIFSNPIYIRD